MRALVALGLLAVFTAFAFRPDVSAFSPDVSAFSREVSLEALPAGARQTLARIEAGGPFPHKQDGRVFGNRERLLPARARGYYREYTVSTPGARDRGARRIVAGRDGEYYYTEDHYRSFRRIVR